MTPTLTKTWTCSRRNLGRDRVPLRRALGMALTLCGTLLVIWNPNGVTISNGLMFVVLSSAAGSLGAILMKQIKGVQALQFQAWAGMSAILPLGATRPI